MFRRLALAAAILMAAAGAWAVLGSCGRAAALLVLATDLDGVPRRFAAVHERTVSSRTLEIPTRERMVRAHAYLPDGDAERAIVLVSGVHPDGIDDPRLVHFARSLAAVGFAAITPELPGLFDFEIGPDATDLIEDVAAWASGQTAFTGDVGRVGLAGISFSGGLAIVAAGRSAIRDRVAFVLSIGGHGDLPRTLDALAGGILTDTAEPETDAFGLAIVLASVAPRVVPAEQVDALRAWARTFLTAGHMAFDDQRRGELFAEAERLERGLPELARWFARRARAADSAALRPHLLEHVRELAGDPSLSPERAPPPGAPIYLLHGTDDPVIPPAESELLAEHLRAHTEVHLLVTPLLSHADIEDALTARRALDLVRFLAALLRE